MKKFENLIRYLPLLEDTKVETGLIARFIRDLYDFEDNNEAFELTRYNEILEKNGLKWDSESMSEADVSDLDSQCVMALIMAAVRAERFCDGALLDFFENGSMKKWLTRLQKIDAADCSD